MLLNKRRLQAMKMFAMLGLGAALIGVAPDQVKAQVNLIGNGDFENTVALAVNTCNSNLTNAEFNVKMLNVTAFGTADEIDIYKGQCEFGSAPQSGTTKIAINTQGSGGGAPFDAFSFDLIQPLVGGATYTLQFYAQTVIVATTETPAPVQIGLSSINPTSFGTLIFTSGVPSTAGWTQFTHTFVAPFAAKFLTVRNEQIGVDTKEVWNHLDNFSLIGAGPTITTVAGTGTAGFNGDGTPATAKQLNFPFGVATGPDGSIYIADRNNHRIRKVTFDPTTGTPTISTVAGTGVPSFGGDGGPAASAQLNSPMGVAVETAVVDESVVTTALLIADSNNHVIRKVIFDLTPPIDPPTISTVAGEPLVPGFRDRPAVTDPANPPPPARFWFPRSVAVADGDLIVADANNHRIRRVDVATQSVTTIAGQGRPRFSGDGFAATAADLNSPVFVAVNGANILIADAGNHRIREINSDGFIDTIAGAGTVRINPDGSLTPNGDEFDTGESGFAGDGGPATGPEAEARLNSPSAVAVDQAGNIYIADLANNRIRKVASGVITTFAGIGPPPPLENGNGIGDGGPPTAAKLTGPNGVAVGPGTLLGGGVGSQALFIADLGHQRIRGIPLQVEPDPVPAPTP